LKRFFRTAFATQTDWSQLCLYAQSCSGVALYTAAVVELQHCWLLFRDNSCTSLSLSERPQYPVPSCGTHFCRSKSDLSLLAGVKWVVV